MCSNCASPSVDPREIIPGLGWVPRNPEDKYGQAPSKTFRQVYSDPAEPGAPPMGSNPKDALGAKKLSITKVPASAIIYIAQGMAEGAAKYGPYNWRHNKVVYTIYLDAALRHIMAVLDGENTDPDSVTGKSHLAGAMASLAVLVDAIESGNVIDDRPPVGPASAMLERLKKSV